MQITSSCGSTWGPVGHHLMHRFSTAAKKEELRMELWDYHHLNHWDLGGQIYITSCWGDNVFALMPWLVKPYSRRQLTREERIANYRISQGRRVVENSFGIHVKRFKVLLTTMEQRPKVVRDIVLTCVVLHNMLRSPQWGADRPPTPADDIKP